MKNENSQKEYRKKYNIENKIVTFPLKIPFYNELKRRSVIFDSSTNSYAKMIVTNFLNNETVSTLTNEQKEYLNQYIRISRGIANNINQIAHQTNIEKQIDVNIFIQMLKKYEDTFNQYIHK